LKQTLKKVNWLGWAQVLTVFALMLVPVFFSARAASAAGQLPVPPGLEAVPGLNNNKYTLNGLIIRVITWILAITLAVDVLFMIIGGFLYITSAGNEERAKKGRTTVINAIIGLVIIILAYVIANVISSFFSTEQIAA
jgi:hypothetical protein